MASLHAFLAQSKSDFVKAKDLSQWTLVVGNEAGDLDSLACALATAFWSSLLSPGSFAPLVLTASDDFKLRPENLLVLKQAGIPVSDLICLEDLHSKDFANASFILVDHNSLLPRFAGGRVAAIFDHHVDDGHHPEANPRVIEPSGSCSSLVVSHFVPRLRAKLGGDYTTGPLADVLRAAILIDTGLKLAPKGKATATDVDAFNDLAASSVHPRLFATDQAVHSELAEYIALLNDTKTHVDFLSVRDLLRRDYKSYSIGDFAYGLATIPLSLSSLLNRDEFVDAVAAWSAENGLGLSGLLFSYRNESTSKHERDLLLCFTNSSPLDVDAFSRAIEKDATLKLSPYPKTLRSTHSEYTFALYHQGNARASRKQVAPSVTGILSDLLQ